MPERDWRRPRFIYSGNCPRCGEGITGKATDGWSNLAVGHRCADETIQSNPKMRMVALARGDEIGWDD